MRFAIILAGALALAGCSSTWLTLEAGAQVIGVLETITEQREEEQ